MADCLLVCESYSPAYQTIHRGNYYCDFNPDKDKLHVSTWKSDSPQRQSDQMIIEEILIFPGDIVVDLVDEENALAIDPEIWKAAVKFLMTTMFTGIVISQPLPKKNLSDSRMKPTFSQIRMVFQ